VLDYYYALYIKLKVGVWRCPYVRLVISVFIQEIASISPMS
jgi:hypothetical protein